MVRINWTLQSADDLENIYEFISKDSLKYAKIQIIRIRDHIRLLKEHPKLGRIVPEIDNENIRELILGNYRIIYKIKSNDLIEIITVHHSAKLLKID